MEQMLMLKLMLGCVDQSLNYSEFVYSFCTLLERCCSVVRA